MTYKNPRGHSVVSAIAAIAVAVVAIGLGVIGVGLLAGLNAIDCHINVFWGCPSGGGGGGGGGGGTVVGNPSPSLCTSLPNACGMTNTGTLSACTTGPTCVNGETCGATVPSNSACPVPSIPAGTGFYAQPDLVENGTATTLYWSTTNTTSCTITGDNGFSSTSSGSGSASSGSVSTGPVTQATTFTLTCEDGKDGPQSSAIVRVNIIPKYKEL